MSTEIYDWRIFSIVLCRDNVRNAFSSIAIMINRALNVSAIICN